MRVTTEEGLKRACLVPAEISNDGKINLNRFEKLEMKGVYFGYAANETLLKDININVYAGNKIAIVGPSGSGKTSITKLMMNIFVDS